MRNNLKLYKPNRFVFHTSSIKNRDFILKNGILMFKGINWLFDTPINDPAIFATSSNNKNDWFDSTWDDDVWKIDTKNLKNKWFKDPNFDYPEDYHIVTFDNIPVSNIKLYKKGTGKDKLELTLHKIKEEYGKDH